MGHSIILPVALLPGAARPGHNKVFPGRVGCLFKRCCYNFMGLLIKNKAPSGLKKADERPERNTDDQQKDKVQ